MLGLFKAKPPVGPWEKSWTEFRMAWFAEQLGMGRLIEVDALNSLDGRLPPAANYADAVELLKFLGSWMNVDTSQLQLRIHSDVIAPSALGTYEHEGDFRVVEVSQADLEDRDTLTAKLVHELAQESLLASGLLDTQTPDYEWTVDLFPVFVGAGLFAANTTLRGSNKGHGNVAWWSIKQRGYLPSRIFGYALALFVYVRNDDAYDWAKFLRKDAQLAFHESLKYLEKTHDTVFTRDSVNQPRDRMAMEAIADELRKGSPSRKISAMWELSLRAAKGKPETSRKIVDALVDCARHKHPDVRAVAASTLPDYNWTPEGVQEVLDALKDHHEDVRASAAGAMGKFAGVDDNSIIESLTESLRDDIRLVVFNAARSLVHFGDAAEPALKSLLKRFRQAMIDCRESDGLTILWAINSICDHPQAALDEFFGPEDQEYREFATEMLEQLNSLV